MKTIEHECQNHALIDILFFLSANTFRKRAKWFSDLWMTKWGVKWRRSLKMKHTFKRSTDDFFKRRRKYSDKNWFSTATYEQGSMTKGTALRSCNGQKAFAVEWSSALSSNGTWLSESPFGKNQHCCLFLEKYCFDGKW